VTNRTRWLVTLAVGAVVVAPAVWPHASDGFPLSTYPMFTSERGRVVAIDTVVLVDGERTERLSPELIAGTDEPVLASATVTRAIVGGLSSLDLLCHEVADRLDDDRHGEVQVVTETYDTIELLRHDAPPQQTIVHGRCPATGAS
jgi:hypothetical protein